LQRDFPLTQYRVVTSVLIPMPTYEYECLKCKKTFDCVQSMKDSALKTCPKENCRQKTWGKGKVKRLLSSGAGLIFKGSGFYITDYRSDSYKQGAKKDSESSSVKTDSTTAKKDSTPTKKTSKKET
jgi:putative FmdB family regulatory protein